ncbi:MAG: ABC transporter permease, partial [Ignavibacteria bacterium]|nr:ABC transporter permease [Ignavibacteria bacterium]
MFNYRILGIIKRELKEKLLSKSFILTTVLFPVFLFVIGGVQALLITDEATSKLNIVCEDQKLTQSFQKELSQSDLMKEGKYSFEFFTMNREELKKHLDDNKIEMLDDKLTGIVFIPATALKDKKLEYYSKSPNNISLSRRIEGPINKVLIDA